MFFTIFLALNIILHIILLIVVLILLASVIRGAAFIPTKPETVKKMIALANVRPGEKAVDLGSGDGRIVIALAKAGIQAHGYEINPLLVWWARRKISKAGLTDKAFIHWKSFWGQDLSSFDIVTIFGINYIMPGLEKKLRKELKAGSRVVTNAFTFPNWPHAQKADGVYLYKQDTILEV